MGIKCCVRQNGMGKKRLEEREHVPPRLPSPVWVREREEEEECYLWEFPWDTAQGRGDRGACGKTAGTKAGTNRVLRRGKNETNISSPLL